MNEEIRKRRQSEPLQESSPASPSQDEKPVFEEGMGLILEDEEEE